MPALRHPFSKAQTMMEYLLVMVVVAVIVFGAFAAKGGVLSRTQTVANQYFKTGSAAIMGGYYDGERYVTADPVKVDGDWCAWSSFVNGVRMRECACPRPAFGGAPCGGDAFEACEGDECLASTCDKMKNFIWIEGEGCGCADGYSWDVTQQSCIYGDLTSCTGGALLQEGACVCPDQTYWDVRKGACVDEYQCKDDGLVELRSGDGLTVTGCVCENKTAWDADTRKCVSVCDESKNMIVQEVNGVKQCDCLPGYYWDVVSQSCINKVLCGPGMELKDGACVCPDESYWDVREGSCVDQCQGDGLVELRSDDGLTVTGCVCKDKTKWVENVPQQNGSMAGQCLAICAESSEPGDVGTKCTCPEGTKLETGAGCTMKQFCMDDPDKCPCPANTEWLVSYKGQTLNKCVLTEAFCESVGLKYLPTVGDGCGCYGYQYVDASGKCAQPDFKCESDEDSQAKNMWWNEDKKQCECFYQKPYFTNWDVNQQKCVEQSELECSGNTELTGSGSSKACVCKSGYHYDASKSGCVEDSVACDISLGLIMTIGDAKNPRQCVCPAGTSWKGAFCF